MLELKNISFQVDAEGAQHEILDHVNLTLPDGKILWL